MLCSVYGDDGWLSDNEVYTEERFELFFKSVGKCWKQLLAKSDAELGLKEPGYRKKITSMLDEFTVTANEALENYDDVTVRFKV